MQPRSGPRALFLRGLPPSVSSEVLLELSLPLKSSEEVSWQSTEEIEEWISGACSMYVWAAPHVRLPRVVPQAYPSG